jgi:hypothetical protein
LTKERDKDELGLRDAQRFNGTEKNRLLVEIMLPDQFTAGLGSSRKASGGGLCVLEEVDVWSGNVNEFGAIFQVLRLLLDTYKPFVLQRR